MKKTFAFFAFIVILSSCAKSVTPYQAAQGGYKKCRAVR